MEPPLLRIGPNYVPSYASQSPSTCTLLCKPVSLDLLGASFVEFRLDGVLTPDSAVAQAAWVSNYVGFILLTAQLNLSVVSSFEWFEQPEDCNAAWEWCAHVGRVSILVPCPGSARSRRRRPSISRNGVVEFVEWSIRQLASCRRHN